MPTQVDNDVTAQTFPSAVQLTITITESQNNVIFFAKHLMGHISGNGLLYFAGKLSR